MNYLTDFSHILFQYWPALRAFLEIDLNKDFHIIDQEYDYFVAKTKTDGTYDDYERYIRNIMDWGYNFRYPEDWGTGEDWGNKNFGLTTDLVKKACWGF